MKKLISLFLIMATLASILLLSGCGLFDIVPTTYDNADKYTAGNAEFEGKVDSFTIWWLAGKVTLRTHKENTIKIEETANRELDTTFSLHYRHFNASDYGDILYIRYSASGNFDFGDLKKDITVYLPENDDMDITVNVDTAEVDVDLSQFENTLEEITVLNNSGKVSVKIDSADSVRISGANDDNVKDGNEYFFRASGTVYDLGISASYAKIDAAAKEIRNGDMGSVFEDLTFYTEKARALKLSNSRGTIDATVLDFETLDIDTLDSPCELTFSSDASFTLTLKDTNKFNSKVTAKEVSVEFDGVTKEGNVYTVNGGNKKVSVATDSTLRVIPQKAAE